jgi:hypothetical protein
MLGLERQPSENSVGILNLLEICTLLVYAGPR